MNCMGEGVMAELLAWGVLGLVILAYEWWTMQR